MRAKVQLLALLLGNAASASASDWKLASRPLSSQRVEVDRSSISRNGDVVAVWTRVSAAPPAPGTPEAEGAPAAALLPDSMVEYLMEVACGAKMIRISTASMSGSQMNPFGSADPSPYTFQTINTAVGFAVMSAACAPEKEAKTAPAYDPDATQLNITPQRTSPRRNPWSFMATPGY